MNVLKKFLFDAFASAAGAALSTLAILTGAYIFLGGTIEEFLTQRIPTCQTPRDLHPVPKHLVSATDGGTQSAPNFLPAKAVDGFGGSIWLPRMRINHDQPMLPTFAKKEEGRSLQVLLPEPLDVRLICVNNGLANSEWNYANWGKVRTIRTSWDDSETISTLQSLPVERMGDEQEVARGIGVVDKFTIELIDAHAGIKIHTYNKTECGGSPEWRKGANGMTRIQSAHTEGCIIEPTRRAGLSEISIYYSE